MFAVIITDRNLCDICDAIVIVHFNFLLSLHPPKLRWTEEKQKKMIERLFNTINKYDNE